jgi:hypothetical protein
VEKRGENATKGGESPPGRGENPPSLRANRTKRGETQIGEGGDARRGGGFSPLFPSFVDGSCLARGACPVRRPPSQFPLSGGAGRTEEARERRQRLEETAARGALKTSGNLANFPKCGMIRTSVPGLATSQGYRSVSPGSSPRNGGLAGSVLRSRIPAGPNFSRTTEVTRVTAQRAVRVLGKYIDKNEFFLLRPSPQPAPRHQRSRLHQPHSHPARRHSSGPRRP